MVEIIKILTGITKDNVNMVKFMANLVMSKGLTSMLPKLKFHNLKTNNQLVKDLINNQLTDLISHINLNNPNINLNNPKFTKDPIQFMKLIGGFHF
jgi:rRNA processing protein Krr1/Pno1